MVKRHKRSLTLAALVLLLAQVFLMTFCNITAIAVTKEESSGSLFDNEFGNASVSYEETSAERLKWTIHLTKATQETATRFMLEITGDGQAVTPENVQVLTKSNPTMSFAAGNGAGQITAGMAETAATTAGSAAITFDTNRNYTAMTVKPKLIADVNPETDLLAGNTGKSFTIPQVATSESTSENSGVAVSEAPVSESSATEATSSTEVAVSETTSFTEQEGTTDSTEVTGGGDEAVISTEESETTAESILDEVSGAPQYSGFVSLTGAELLADPLDPFKYYDSSNDAGIYPKHESNKYSQSGSEIKNSDNIRNYNYGSSEKTETAQDDVAIYDTSKNGLDLQTGYHEYGSDATGHLNTKKTVMPTDDPNTFQVQLDTIGDAIRPLVKVDIVLVLDKSWSMMNTSPTRWSQLQTAVNTFSTNILKENEITDAESGENRIQIGMVGFSSDGGNQIARADVASFSDLNGTNLTNGFTSDADNLTNHPIYKQTPGSSGTPTFIGVDAGLALLHNTNAGARDDAKKVLITITDGSPTFRPGDGYSLDSSTKSNINSSKTLRYTSHDVEGNGRQIEPNRQPTIDFVKDKYAENPDSFFYSIGFDTDDDANEVVEALGPNGAYAASSVDSLVTALKNSVAESVYTIANATVTDPMSTYVTLDEDSIKKEALYLSDDGEISTGNYPFAKDINVIPSGTKIVMNNMILGYDTSGRQGYRITYNVTLNEEYRDGTFYPTNEMTYLANGNGKNVYYAVPSVRVAPEPVDVQFTKTNESGKELIGAQFKLTSLTDETVTYESNVTGDDGIVKFEDVVPGDYKLTEIKTPTGYQTISPIQVRVSKEGTITRLDGGELLEQVKNTLKPIDVSLHKTDEKGNALTGATFVLKDKDGKEFPFTADTNGLHQLDGITSGEYELFETVAPDGYQVLGKIGDLVIDDYGVPTFTPDPNLNQNISASLNPDSKDSVSIILSDITNVLKPFDLTVNKTDDQKKALEGAEFTLTKEGDDSFKIVLPGENGSPTSKFEFKNLAPGTYFLEETDAPDGYRKLATPIKIIIDEFGKVTIDSVEQEDVLIDGTDNNQITLTVENDPKAPLPSTGGPGTLIFSLIGMLALGATGLYFYFRKDQEVA